MTQAKSGDRVQVHYVGTLEDGSEFDSSADREPLEFTIGEGRLLGDFEDAVVGMAEGDTKTVTVAAADAYGQHDNSLVFTVDRATVPEHVPLNEGARLQARGDDGKPMHLTVVQVNEKDVTFDANHPLAGEDLNFELKLVSIK